MLPLTVWLLCGIGAYASARMAGAAAKPGARLYFGIPNALVGLAYYPAVAAAFPFGAIPAVRLGLAAAAACAALTSLRLIYELTFVGRDDCASCWTANACNLVLAVAVASLWAH